MRTRSTTTGGFTDTQISYSDTGSGPIPDYISFTGTESTKTIEDVLTPGFFALKKCGKFLPLNTVLISTETVKRTPGPVSYENLASGGIGTGSMWLGDTRHISPPVSDDALTDAAVLAAAANAASAKFDLSTWVAEFRSTVGTMAQIGRLFNDVTFRMAKTAARVRSDPWKEFREIWLLGRFGVRPLVYDYRDAAAALRALHSDLTIVEGKGLQQENLSEDFDSGWSPVSGYWQRRVQESSRTKFYHRGWAACKFESKWRVAFQTDVFTTAWELLPYSLVVDYFIDVGAWVKTLQPRLSGDYLGIQASLKEETIWEQTVTYQGVPGVVSGSLGPFKTSEEIVQYGRAPTSVPVPPVVPELTLPKVIDLITLFVGGRRRVEMVLNRR